MNDNNVATETRCDAHFDGGGYELSGFCNRPLGHEGPHNYPNGDDYPDCDDAVSNMSRGLEWSTGE